MSSRTGKRNETNGPGGGKGKRERKKRKWRKRETLRASRSRFLPPPRHLSWLVHLFFASSTRDVAGKPQIPNSHTAASREWEGKETETGQGTMEKGGLIDSVGKRRRTAGILGSPVGFALLKTLDKELPVRGPFPMELRVSSI